MMHFMVKVTLVLILKRKMMMIMTRIMMMMNFLTKNQTEILNLKNLLNKLRLATLRVT